MTLEGTVLNGVIVLDGAAILPDGMRVKVQSVEPKRSDSLTPLAERLLALAGTATGLPEDMARNHDHYVHTAGC